MATKLTPTQEAHLTILATIGKEQWPEENWITAPYLKTTLDKAGFHFTALEQHQQPIGSIMAVEEDYPKYWIHYFIVDQAYRRQGIGSQLLQKVEGKLKKGNFLFVDLEQIRDKEGVSFYLENGFKIMGKVKNWFDGREGIILAKKII